VMPKACVAPRVERPQVMTTEAEMPEPAMAVNPVTQPRESHALVKGSSVVSESGVSKAPIG